MCKETDVTINYNGDTINHPTAPKPNDQVSQNTDGIQPQFRRVNTSTNYETIQIQEHSDLGEADPPPS